MTELKIPPLPQPGAASLAITEVEGVRFVDAPGMKGIAVEIDGSIVIAKDGIGFRTRFDDPDRLCEFAWLLLSVAANLDLALCAASADLDSLVARYGAKHA